MVRLVQENLHSLKKSMASIGQDTVILAFRCTDMDVSDERIF